MSIEVFMQPYYLAPFTAAIYALGLQAMRHLWLWRPGGQRVGRTMIRLTLTISIVMAGLRPFDRPLHFPVPQIPWTQWNSFWYGPDHYGTERASIESKLDELPGEQLVLVRYSSKHDPLDTWVYNAADIDGSKVIWAREMDAASDRELFRYYKNRQIWLVQPDLQPVAVSLYPVTEQVAAPDESHRIRVP
jgi:hypothetical protein